MPQLPEVSWDATAAAPTSWELIRPILERIRWYFLLHQLWAHVMCCLIPIPDLFSPMSSSIPSIINPSLSSLFYIKIYIHVSDPVNQDYITISIYLCSCVSVSLRPKRQPKALPWVAFPWWSLLGAAKPPLPHGDLAMTQLQKLFSGIALLFSFLFVCAFLWDYVLPSPSRKKIRIQQQQ